ncbi:MAG: response regulator [Polyangia bacterium]
MLAELKARFLQTFIADSRARLRDALAQISVAGPAVEEAMRSIAATMHTIAGEAMLIGLPNQALMARAAGGAARRYLETRSSPALIACARALRSLARTIDELESAPPASSTKPEPGAAEAPRGPRPRALVVDDSPLNSALLREGLEREGFEASALGDDMPEILRHLQQQPTQILLVDWMMPGCDTRELCRRIRGMPELDPLRVILITSLPEVEAAEHARELGAVAALTKELGIPTIVSRVRALLRDQTA